MAVMMMSSSYKFQEYFSQIKLMIITGANQTKLVIKLFIICHKYVTYTRMYTYAFMLKKTEFLLPIKFKSTNVYI